MNADTLNFNTSRGATTAFVARPETQASAAVILIQEWWGINDHIRDLAGRYANEGYLCVAPDLYRGRVAADTEDASALMQALKDKDKGLWESAGRALGKIGLPAIPGLLEALKSKDATGTILFDKAKGRLDSSEMNLKLEGKLTIDIGGMPTEVELSQTQKTTVKTSVPSTVTSVFSMREKPGASERVTAWLSWNAVLGQFFGSVHWSNDRPPKRARLR